MENYNIFDSHTHINSREFDNDIPDVIERAKALDVTQMLVISYDKESTEKMLALTAKYPQIYGGFGCHPENAASYDKDFEAYLTDVLKNDKVKALGEIGLDYHCDTDKKVQWNVLEKQIELAKKMQLPISIHDRDALEDCYALLKNARIKEIGGIMHSFNGDRKWAEKFLELGFELSYSGVVTFGNAKEVADSAIHTPLEHLLVETDAPYLTPMPFRGKINEPAMTRYTLEFIAKKRGLAAKELAKITTENAKRVLKIK